MPIRATSYFISWSRLADGTEVSDKTKAVLWILENEVIT